MSSFRLVCHSQNDFQWFMHGSNELNGFRIKKTVCVCVCVHGVVSAQRYGSSLLRGKKINTTDTTPKPINRNAHDFNSPTARCGAQSKQRKKEENKSPKKKIIYPKKYGEKIPQWWCDISTNISNELVTDWGDFHLGAYKSPSNHCRSVNWSASITSGRIAYSTKR